MHNPRVLLRYDEEKKVINSSVLKSKKRKIKISDIYTCDKNRRGRKNGFPEYQRVKTGLAGVVSLGAAFTLFHSRRTSDSSECNSTAETIHQAGRALCSRLWPAGSNMASWEETRSGKKEWKKKKALHSPHEISGNVQCGGLKTSMAAASHSRSRHGTIVSNILYYKLSSGLHCVLKICTVWTALIPKTLAALTASRGIIRHTNTHTRLCTSTRRRTVIVQSLNHDLGPTNGAKTRIGPHKDWSTWGLRFLLKWHLQLISCVLCFCKNWENCPFISTGGTQVA